MSVFGDINTPITTLSSISKTRKTQLQNANMYTLGNVLENIPVKYESRTRITSLFNACTATKVLVTAQVVTHDYMYFKRKGRILKIIIQDETDKAELHCYGRDFLKLSLHVGHVIHVWGKFSPPKFGSYIHTSTFEIITNKSRMLKVVPYYKVPKEITQLAYYNIVQKILKETNVPKLHPYENLYPYPTLTRGNAIINLHSPINMETINQARYNLAFDELLLFHLSIKMTSSSQNNRSTPRKKKVEYARALITLLPFALTKGQISVINEIQTNLWNPTSMNRLLQGDVGSGKTLVALICALTIIENGEQVVLIAPSESLAIQHFKRISTLLSSLAKALGKSDIIQCDLLTGSLTKQQRQKTLKAIKENNVQLIIGTHTVYSPDVHYNNLGFVIIDEQHRFGIGQRSTLLKKGGDPDVLLMSATPIPRSLALTTYSNMDISTLKEKPAIQQKVKTRLVLFERRQQIYHHIRSYLEKKRQVFFVFPQIGEETQDAAMSAITMYKEIEKELAPFSASLLHSKVDSEQQTDIMQKFESGEIAILVATTIIEVGIDIPNATVICIFNAERFGLATLHQLRGRVGRGALKGEAILVYQSPLNDIAKERLKIIYEETDGFVIAEKDLFLRGPGDIHQLGLRQSGSLLFQFANIEETSHLLTHTHALANRILSEDPYLHNQAHENLHTSLYNTNTIL